MASLSFKKLFSFKKLNSFTKDPDLDLPSILSLDISILRKYNIKKMILDLDQTFAIQSTTTIPAALLEQLEIFKTFFHSENLCFLSNEINAERSNEIQKITGVHVVQSKYKKPDENAYIDALNYLHESPGKHVAMVGDRLWTDILGANSVGLFTIKVRPLTPTMDKVGAAIVRKLENTKEKYGLLKFFSLSAQLFAILGIGIIQLYSYFSDLTTNVGRFLDTSSVLIYLNILFIIISNIYYWSVISINSRSFRTTENKNVVTFYWSTYPLFFRQIFSTIFYAYALIAHFWFHNISTSIFVVANFYCFISHVSLIFSLFSFYHSHKWRIFRIIIDIGTVFLISYNLPTDYTYYSLLLLFIPVATASKYYGWPTSIGTAVSCSLLSILICWLASNHTLGYPMWTHILLLSSLFFCLTIMQKTDSKEASNPIDYFIKLLHQNGLQDNKAVSLLKIFSKVMNCEGVYYILSDGKGYYYLQSQSEEKGDIHKASATEILNYLKYNSKNVIFDPKTTALEINQKQKRLLNDLNSETVLQPPPIKGLQSVIITSLPNNNNSYLIFINSTTHSGVTRKKFSISHLRTACICNILISNSEVII
jgi:uncharacterized protein